MKILAIAALCVLGSANAFVLPGSKVQLKTSLNASTMDNRMRNRDFRTEELFGGQNSDWMENGFNVGPDRPGGNSPYERYDPRIHGKDGNERRFDLEDRQYDMRRNQRPHEGGHASRSPIVESADGGNRLERYDPNLHRNNGESRFEPTRFPRNNEERIRDRPMGRGPENFSWDQSMDRRGPMMGRGGPNGMMDGGPGMMGRGGPNGMMDRGGPDGMMDRGRPDGMMDRGGPDGMMDRGGPNGMMDRGGPGMMGRGGANRMMDHGEPMNGRGGHTMTNKNSSFNSGNSGRLVTPDNELRRQPYGDARGTMSSRDKDWWNGNPSGTRRDRQEARSTAELLKSGGTDMFENNRRAQKRNPGRNMGGNPRRYENEFEYPDRNRPFAERYERADRNFDRESRTGRRWEEPYRVGDRPMLGNDALGGPQRLDGGTRRQWTFEDDVGSVQLEMWTEGLPLMATVEIFEKGGQRKNSFDVYVEDGYNRPYSTVLDLPHQAGGTILIRNDGPIEYPLVANVQPFGGMRDGYQDGEEGW